MIVCFKCKKEMRCTKNGLGVRYFGGHVYPGDKYTCPCCKMEIIHTNSAPVYDPDNNINTVDGKNWDEECESCKISLH